MNISFGQNMSIAIEGVWVHRFRSLLTILGIVIGITTVVTVASLLTGLRQGVVDFFQELGPDNIFLFKSSGDPSQDARNAKERWRWRASSRRIRPSSACSIRGSSPTRATRLPAPRCRAASAPCCRCASPAMRRAPCRWPDARGSSHAPPASAASRVSSSGVPI